MRICEMLQPLRDSDNVEVLWRLANSTFERSKHVTEKSARKQLVVEAHELIKKALKSNQDNYAVHDLMAILLDAVNKFSGHQARVEDAEAGKYHMKKSIELNPNGPLAHYLLGNWHYNFAVLTPQERKIAEMLYGAIPNPSMEEALQYLLKAENLEPNFYSMNLLLLAKTYYKLQKYNTSLEYCNKTLNFVGESFDDKKAKKEATVLLKKLNSKLKSSEK